MKSIGGAMAVAALALTLSGCGVGGGERPTATEPAAPAERAQSLLVDANRLGAGWRDSNLPQDTFRTTICGVDIEPVEAVDSAHARYAQGGLGPFVEQYVRVYSSGNEQVPGSVVADLREALRTCDTYVAKGNRPDSPTLRVQVSPLKVEGLPTAAVAFRQTPKGSNPVVNDTVFIERGDRLVVFVAYAVRGTPDPAVLEAAVRALPGEG